MVERVVSVTQHVDTMQERVASVVVGEPITISTVAEVVATLVVAADNTAPVEEAVAPTTWALIRHPIRVLVQVMGML